MACIELGTVGEWAAAVGTIAAVGVAAWVPTLTVKREAAHAGDLEAAQVVAAYGYFESDEMPDLPRVSARVKILNYSDGVIRSVAVETTWSHGDPCVVWEYLPEVESVDLDDLNLTVTLHHLAPREPDGSVLVGAGASLGQEDPKVVGVVVRWVDRHGVARSTVARELSDHRY